jgi:hypothetical protein
VVALFALVGAAQALAPGAAMAEDDTGTLASLCFERIEGEFVDLLTGEKCEPPAESAGGERIEIEVEYIQPACPPRNPICGLPYKMSIAQRPIIERERSRPRRLDTRQECLNLAEEMATLPARFSRDQQMALLKESRAALRAEVRAEARSLQDKNVIEKVHRVARGLHELRRLERTIAHLQRGLIKVRSSTAEWYEWQCYNALSEK